MKRREYTKPCGCRISWEGIEEGVISLIAKTCGKHEAVIVLRDKGDQGKLESKLKQEEVESAEGISK